MSHEHQGDDKCLPAALNEALTIPLHMYMESCIVLPDGTEGQEDNFTKRNIMSAITAMTKKQKRYGRKPKKEKEDSLRTKAKQCYIAQ